MGARHYRKARLVIICTLVEKRVAIAGIEHTDQLGESTLMLLPLGQ